MEFSEFAQGNKRKDDFGYCLDTIEGLALELDPAGMSDDDIRALQAVTRELQEYAETYRSGSSVGSTAGWPERTAEWSTPSSADGTQGPGTPSSIPKFESLDYLYGWEKTELSEPNLPAWSDSYDTSHHLGDDFESERSSSSPGRVSESEMGSQVMPGTTSEHSHTHSRSPWSMSRHPPRSGDAEWGGGTESKPGSEVSLLKMEDESNCEKMSFDNEE